MSYVAALGLAVDLGTKLLDKRTQDGFESLSPSASAGAPLTVEFPAGTLQQKVPHGLQRAPQGYNIVCRMADASVWDYQAPDSNFFYLEASAAVTIKIQVF